MRRCNDIYEIVTVYYPTSCVNTTRTTTSTSTTLAPTTTTTTTIAIPPGAVPIPIVVGYQTISPPENIVLSPSLEDICNALTNALSGNVVPDSLVVDFTTYYFDETTFMLYNSVTNTFAEDGYYFIVGFFYVTNGLAVIVDVEEILALCQGDTTTTTTSSSTSSTTTTTTTACRPPGLLTGNAIISMKPNSNTINWNWKTVSVSYACEAFNYLKDVYDPNGGGGSIGYQQIQYSQLQIGEILYLNPNQQPSTGCEVLQNGYYWFQPNDIVNKLSYFYSLSQINIVTVVDGIITAIDVCPYVPTTTTTTTVNPCPDCVAHDVTIGTQIWTGCNLDVTTYANGDPIPEVTDPTAWAGLTTGAWCYYNNDSVNGTTYGKLYNWYAVNDPRGLAPAGYHVPTEIELNTLSTYLGGDSIAGGKMKEVGLCHWDAPNSDATNNSGFTGLPGGYRYISSFINIKQHGAWWCSINVNVNDGFSFLLYNNVSYLDKGTNNKKNGFSVRLIKD